MTPKPTTNALFVALVILSAPSASDSLSFAGRSTTRLNMGGINGKGWENDSFLEGLGGGEEERQIAKDDYTRYKLARERMQEQQAKMMGDERMMKFMQARNAKMGEGSSSMPAMPSEYPSGGWAAGGESGGGGSRFRQMMEKSQKARDGNPMEEGEGYQ